MNAASTLMFQRGRVHHSRWRTLLRRMSRLAGRAGGITVFEPFDREELLVERMVLVLLALSR
jgi:hypothetical protein